MTDPSRTTVEPRLGALPPAGVPATAGLSRRQLLARGSVLLVGGAALLAGCTGVSVPRPTASPTGGIRAQLDEVLTVIAGADGMFGVALRDLNSGAEYGFHADYASQSASMVKPMLVLMALVKARSIGGALPAEQAEQASQAITVSDNDAADALWTWAGAAPAYDELAATLGMSDTHADEHRSESWSWTWTTPADQLKLIRQLADGSAAITDAERAFVWELMGQVADDQQWGVGARRSDSVTTHLKNGWVKFESSDNLWAVNSIGQVTGDGRNYQLAMMTRRPDFDTGRETLNEAGRWVFDILGTGPLEVV